MRVPAGVHGFIPRHDRLASLRLFPLPFLCSLSMPFTELRGVCTQQSDLYAAAGDPYGVGDLLPLLAILDP